MFMEGVRPRPPTRPAHRSEMMSPYRLGITSTSNYIREGDTQQAAGCESETDWERTPRKVKRCFANCWAVEQCRGLHERRCSPIRQEHELLEGCRATVVQEACWRALAAASRATRSSGVPTQAVSAGHLTRQRHYPTVVAEASQGWTL